MIVEPLWLPSPKGLHDHEARAACGTGQAAETPPSAPDLTVYSRHAALIRQRNKRTAASRNR
jgi:hypothetical protein